MTPLLGPRRWSDIDEEAVTLATASERMPARTVIWAAGVRGLAAGAAAAARGELDRAGRVTVEPDLTLPGHPEVIALGDMVRVRDGQAAARASRRSRCSRAATRPSSSARA